MKTWTKVFAIALLTLGGCQSTPEQVDQRDLTLQEVESSPTAQANPAETETGHSRLELDEPRAEEQKLRGLVRNEELEALQPQPGAILFTGRTEVQGVLELYWIETWPHEDPPNRALRAHFRVGEEQAQELVEFPDGPYDRTPWKLELDLATGSDIPYVFSRDLSPLIAGLIEHLEEVPENFLSDQVGRVAQAGTLTLVALLSYIECDSPYTSAKFESFEPLELNDETRAFTEKVLAEPPRGGCDDHDPFAD